jgi:hypothetical protein
MFMRKNTIDSHTGFQKLADNARIFGQKNHVFRKIHNTMDDINGVALPALGIAAITQPELAPVFGGIGLGLKGADSIAGYVDKKNGFVGGNDNKKSKPRLEK